VAGGRTTAPARERLLDAAEELFYAHGIAATGVDAVLRRAGASPATLYAHFAGKDGLVAAYLERRHERWRSTWDAVLARTEDPDDRLLSVFDALARFRRDSGATRAARSSPPLPSSPPRTTRRTPGSRPTPHCCTTGCTTSPSPPVRTTPSRSPPSSSCSTTGRWPRTRAEPRTRCPA
jgi:AcrR family transcriptional regulator